MSSNPMTEEFTAADLARKAIRDFDNRVSVLMQQSEWDELHRQVKLALIKAYALGCGSPLDGGE